MSRRTETWPNGTAVTIGNVTVPIARSTQRMALRDELGHEEYDTLRQMWEGRQHHFVIPLVREMVFTTLPHCHIDNEDLPYVERRSS